MPTPAELQLAHVFAQYDLLCKAGDPPGLALQKEQAMVKRVLDEISWQHLDDGLKQQKRKSMLSVMDRWSYEEGGGIDLSYEISVVNLYDCIEEILPQISPGSALGVRLTGALLLEKFFINEHQDFGKMRHLDFYVWTEILVQSKLVEAGLNLTALDDLFKQMYRSWPKRPYQEVL